MKTWNRLLGAVALLLLLPHAQAWPDKPVRLIVPYAAGGAADTVARLIAAQLGERLGQQVLVDNRAGAGGTIGAAEVARALPDGHTLLLDATAHAVNPALLPKLPYDTAKAFEPVSLLVRTPNLLVVPTASPARTIGDLVRMARSAPGKLSYASAGNGSAQHLAAELFKQGHKLYVVHVPYRGGAPALTDLAGGQVDMMFSVVTASYPLVKAGRLRALAVTGERRSAGLPDLPTVAESGLPGYSVYEWNGVFAPAGTPKPVIERLETEIRAALALPAVRERLAEMGAQPVGSTAREFGEFVRSETQRWAQVIKASGIKAD